MAIGNQARMLSAQAAAGSRNRVDGIVARNELGYVCRNRSPRYAWSSPA